jgi:type IV pilus assembly protein PilM
MADDKSIWKKEISLRRKPKEEKAAQAPRAPAPAPAPKPKSADTSVWKKEISLRRKPKEDKGAKVPPAPQPTAKAESVAELLRPIAEDTLEPVVLPPVTPPISQTLAPPLPPVSAPKPAPVPAAEPEPEPVAEETVELPAAEPQPAPAPVAELPPPVAAPKLQPPPERPTRRMRRQLKREAEKVQKEKAKEQKQAEKQTAKEAKKAPATQGHKRLVGLKIGASQLAAAQIVNSSGPKVIRMARAPLERGIVVGGELREPDQLVPALKAFFRKNKLPRNAVRLGIANNRIGVRTFEISGIEDPKQLANAIRFRAQETLPIPLDEAVLDYRILSETVNEEGVRTRRVLLVVAHKELVERYVAACKKAGLKLVGIDLESFALLRALGDPAQPAASSEDAGLVCLTIGHDRTSLAVSDGRVCEFTRVLAWGGSSLDIALARALDLTPTEAEPIKYELSLVEQGEGAGLDPARANAARQAMSKEIEAFARELVASLRFYQEQPGSLGIGEILVTGGGAQCLGFPQELERLIGVKVRIADPLARLKLPRKLRRDAGDDIASLAVAVGLGIED